MSNYFHKDTVEQRVYEGIAEDGDFTEIVGDAAPVLANVEKAIEQLALGDPTDENIRTQVDNIKDEVDSLKNRAVQATDMGAAPEVIGHVEEPPDLHGDTNLDDLRSALTNHVLTGPLLEGVAGRPHTYRLTLPAHAQDFSFAANAGVENPEHYGNASAEHGDLLVTFDRETADEHTDDTTLLTYGTPELQALLPKPVAPA